MQLAKPTMPASMLIPLLMMFFGFNRHVCALLLVRLRAEILSRSAPQTGSGRRWPRERISQYGGYAAYVWPSYGLTLVIIVITSSRRGDCWPGHAKKRGVGWRCEEKKMTPRRKRMTLVFGIIAGVSVAGALALSAFRQNVTFFFDPTASPRARSLLVSISAWAAWSRRAACNAPGKPGSPFSLSRI